MTNPELKTVPVTDLAEALRPFANAVFNDNGDVTYNFTAYSTDDLFRAYRLMKRYDALAASPPPPVAGDEGAIKRHADWPIDPDTGLRMLLDDAAPPPPPADLKVEAKALRSKLCLIDICRSDAGCGCLDALADALSAAHAAGKAEGEAEITKLRVELSNLQEAFDDSEYDACRADDAAVAARAEALEEAKRDLPEPYRHPNGIFEDGWNAAAKEAHEALRALISAPLPPREES